MSDKKPEPEPPAEPEPPPQQPPPEPLIPEEPGYAATLAHVPIWSAEGKQIAFLRDGGNEWGIYVVAADGNGEPRHVARTEDCSFDWGVRR